MSGWDDVVCSVGRRRELLYEEIGGLNPRDAPQALCPGGRNRLTGELTRGFWGASCDADLHRTGGFFRKEVVPGAVLIRSHLPDLADVVPAFDVESIEATPGEQLRRASSNRVRFESIEFNRRYLATVPADHDPVALRELFSPGFIDWLVGVDREIDLGGRDRQMWLMWRLRERSAAELELALDAGGELFRRIRAELEETGALRHGPGPWNAGLAPFPSDTTTGQGGAGTQLPE